MSQHTIQTEVEVQLAYDDYAYPVLEITYEYERGYTPKTPRGEYGPIDPPVGDHIYLYEAKLLNGHGMHPKHYRIQEWAEQFLKSDVGRNYAIDCAETDLRAMRHAHLENSRDRDQ